MLRKLSAHIRSAGVGYVALFIALGGVSSAAVSVLPANSVGTAQLKNGAVTGQKVANDTLTGNNIKESTLGIVPNASRLGGKPASSYQRVIGNGCSSGAAIQTISPTGAVTCETNVSSVTSGTGLTSTGTQSNPTLSVDPTVVQSRLTSSCSQGSALASVAQDGTTTCQNTMSQMMGSSGSAQVTTANNALAAQGVSTPSSSAADVVLGTSAVPSTAKDLSVVIATKPGTGNGWIFALDVNGQTSPLNCKIEDNAGGCTDTTDAASIPAGASVYLLAGTDAGSPPPTTVLFGWTDIS